MGKEEEEEEEEEMSGVFRAALDGLRRTHTVHEKTFL